MLIKVLGFFFQIAKNFFRGEQSLNEIKSFSLCVLHDA